MIPFRYAPEIVKNYPYLAGGAILCQGLTNGPTPPALEQLYQAEQRRVAEQIGSFPLSELESLAGWRSAFRGFGVDPTQYRSAAEALLRRLTKKGSIPMINAVVDLCNLVSIRYALPVAAFDLRTVRGFITVRPATGEEWFYPLAEQPQPYSKEVQPVDENGQPLAEHPKPGEVIFIDEVGLVVARRWCWRQSAESAAREDTRNLLVTVEAQHLGGRDQVQRAMTDLHNLLAKFAGSPAFQYTLLP